jgi:hypothetical protein
MAGQSFESNHQTHREVQHGHDNTNHQARHEASHHLTGHHGVDHKNLSKLPSNKAAEDATTNMTLHDSGKEVKSAEAAKKPAEAARPGDVAKPADATKSGDPTAAEKMVAEDMVKDLKNKDLRGQFSKQTTSDIGALGADAAEKGGPEGVKQFGEGLNKAFTDEQTKQGIKPEWQKKFEMGNSTNKWQDFSISKGNVKDTAGFSHKEFPSQPEAPAAPAQAPGEKFNEFFPGS